MVSEKKKMPYRIVYPDNEGKFKPETPFGSKIDYKSRGAISTSKNLNLDSLDKISLVLSLEQSSTIIISQFSYVCKTTVETHASKKSEAL